MSIRIEAKWDKTGLAALGKGQVAKAIKAALRKAGSTALRDMRSEAVKRIRARKRIRPAFISRAIRMRRPKGSSIEAMEWGLDVKGSPVALSFYPHRQTKRGVSVEINKGKRTIVPHAFVATLKSGHVGIFRRRGPERLPIDELFGSRPVDALLHQGEAAGVAERGAQSLSATFARLLPIEMEKGK